MSTRRAAAWIGRLGRSAAALVLLIGLLAQPFALPWHLVLAHHHHDAGHADSGHSHEHPNLPAGHDEEDHDVTSTVIVAQARERLDLGDDSLPPWMAPAPPAAGSSEAAPRRVAWRRASCGAGDQAGAVEVRGARGPPRVGASTTLPSL